MTAVLKDYQVVRTILAPSSDTDWAALQAIPEGVELINVNGFEDVMVVVVALDGVGAPVAGTCGVQLVEHAIARDGRALVIGAAIDAAVPYGTGLICPVSKVGLAAVRIASPTNSPAVLKIYMREAG